MKSKLAAQHLKSPVRAPLMAVENLLLLPGLVRTIEVSKPEQCSVIETALKDNNHIVMATQHPDTQEAVSDFATLCQVARHHQSTDGSYLVMLRGESRVRMEPCNGTASNPIRLCHILRDHYPAEANINRTHRRGELLNLFIERFPRLERNETVLNVLEHEMPLGVLCDLLSDSTPLSEHELRYLLSETNVELRSDFVLIKLRETIRKSHAGAFDFPPSFSGN